MVLNEERNVTLTAYLQAVNGEFANIPKRPAILVLPGGGYQMCSDREPYLSVDCTMGLLMADPEAGAVISSLMAEIQKGMVERYGKEKVENRGGGVDSALFLKNMTLRDILNAGKIPGSVAEELEKQLNRIENRHR